MYVPFSFWSIIKTLSAVTCWNCVVKGRENIALLFLKKRKKEGRATLLSWRDGCISVSTVVALSPGWNGYTLLSSSHRSPKAGWIIPQCYFVSLCCETLITLLLYCETMCSVVECPLEDDTPFDLSLGCGEQVAQSLQYCNWVSLFTLTLWFKDYTSRQSYSTWSPLN